MFCAVTSSASRAQRGHRNVAMESRSEAMASASRERGRECWPAAPRSSRPAPARRVCDAISAKRALRISRKVSVPAAEQVFPAEIAPCGSGQHLAQHDRLEPLRHFAQASASGAPVRPAAPRHRGARAGSVQGRMPDHMTTISACSAPACLSASRIATRSAGLTPSALSASTSCASEAPGLEQRDPALRAVRC